MFQRFFDLTAQQNSPVATSHKLLSSVVLMSLVFSIAFGPIECVRFSDIDRFVNRARVIRDWRGLGWDGQVIAFVCARQVQVNVGHARVFKTVGRDHKRQATPAK